MSETFSEILVGEDGLFGIDDVLRLENSQYQNVLQRAQGVLPEIIFRELQDGVKFNLTADQIYRLDYLVQKYQEKKTQITTDVCTQLSFGHEQEPSSISLPNASGTTTIENPQGVPGKYYYFNDSELSNNDLFPYVEKILPVMQDSIKFLTEYIQSDIFKRRLQALADKSGFCGNVKSIVRELLENFQKDSIIIFEGKKNVVPGTKLIKGRGNDGNNGRIVLSFHIYVLLEYTEEELMSLAVHELTHIIDAHTISSLLQSKIDAAMIDNPYTKGKQNYIQFAPEFYARLMSVRRDLYNFGVNISQDISEQDILNFISQSEKSDIAFNNIYMLEFNGDNDEAYKKKDEYIQNPRFLSAVKRYVELANTLP